MCEVGCMVRVCEHELVKIAFRRAEFIFESEISTEHSDKEHPITHEFWEVIGASEMVGEPESGVSCEKRACKHDFGCFSAIEVGSSMETDLGFANPGTQAFVMISTENRWIPCFWIFGLIGLCAWVDLSYSDCKNITKGLADCLDCLGDRVEWQGWWRI